MPSIPPTPTTSPADAGHPPDAIFVSVKEAAHMLGLSRNQTYTLLDRQLIESRYFGKRRLVLLSSLRAFADALPTERAG